MAKSKNIWKNSEIRVYRPHPSNLTELELLRICVYKAGKNISPMGCSCNPSQKKVRCSGRLNKNPYYSFIFKKLNDDSTCHNLAAFTASLKQCWDKVGVSIKEPLVSLFFLFCLSVYTGNIMFNIFYTSNSLAATQNSTTKFKGWTKVGAEHAVGTFVSMQLINISTQVSHTPHVKSNHISLKGPTLKTCSILKSKGLLWIALTVAHYFRTRKSWALAERLCCNYPYDLPTHQHSFLPRP